MPPAPHHDVVLVLRAFTDSAADLRPGLVELDRRLGRALLRVHAYHRLGADIALIPLRVDAGLLAAQGLTLAELSLALRALGGELIELATCGAAQLRRLRTSIIPRCEVVCREVAGLAAASDAIVSALGLSVEAATHVRRRAAVGTVAPQQRRGSPPRLRFLRGDAWLPGRLARVLDDHLVVVSSAPLPSGERTVIELRAPSVVARLPGVVLPDSDDERSAGNHGFAVRVAADGPRKISDQNVLTWARTQLAAAEPLPHRSEHRIPLCWPARLRDSHGEYLVTVRDVSYGGVFAETGARAIGGKVRLRLPYDMGDAPIDLDGRIARAVDSSLAAESGGPVGIGVTVWPSPRDAERFTGFVARAERRSSHHIMVGARGKRLTEIVRHFASVGYLASGCEDLRSLCLRAADSERPPEVVLLDSSFQQPEMVAQRLGRRDITILKLDGEPISARRLVDAALIE